MELIWTEVTLRLIMAAGLGAIIGLERERKDWAAGMRTHMMVCLGASLTMIVSCYGFSDVLNNDHVTLDPSRVAAQVISGIGFLGAGTILFLRPGTVRGLTTASGLWTVAAIGLAAGGGMYYAAGISTVLALVILWLLQPVQRRIATRYKKKTLVITAFPSADSKVIIEKIMDNKFLDFPNFSMNKSEKHYEIQVQFNSINKIKMAEIIKELHSIEAIKKIEWITT